MRFVPPSPSEGSIQLSSAGRITCASYSVSACSETCLRTSYAAPAGHCRGSVRLLAALADEGAARAPLCLSPAPGAQRSGETHCPRRDPAGGGLPPPRRTSPHGAHAGGCSRASWSRPYGTHGRPGRHR